MSTLVIFLGATLLVTSTARAQRLYNKELDAAAQEALKAVEKVDSKRLFDSQLQNLSTLSQQDFETAFSGIRRATRSHIQSWDTWCSVDADMARAAVSMGYPGARAPVTQELFNANNDRQKQQEACVRLLNLDEVKPPVSDALDPWTKRLSQIDTETRSIQSKIDELRKQPGSGEPKLSALLGKLGDLSEAGQLIQGLKDSPWGGKLQGLTVPASETLDVLKRLKDAYAQFTKRRDDIATVREQLTELQAEMLNIAVLKLAAEEEHLKRLLAIVAKRVKDVQDAADSFKSYRLAVLCERRNDRDLDLKQLDVALGELARQAGSEKGDPFLEFQLKARERRVAGNEEKTLDLCIEFTARKRLQSLTRSLYDAAAVQARSASPEYIAQLRRAQEEERYSIVLSSLEARGYETLVATGVQRLALFHAGGIKPEQIAQLVYQAAQLTGISTIAAKQ